MFFTVYAGVIVYGEYAFFRRVTGLADRGRLAFPFRVVRFGLWGVATGYDVDGSNGHACLVLRFAFTVFGFFVARPLFCRFLYSLGETFFVFRCDWGALATGDHGSAF